MCSEAKRTKSCYSKSMSQYRRNREGSTFFFTVLTEKRKPILTSYLGRKVLRQAIDQVRQEHPFQIIGFVLLPDHIHTIWKLPPNDADYSLSWKKIKARFTKAWNRSDGASPDRTRSRLKRGEHSLWQRRFFEHTCRDEGDLKRCLDYLQSIH